MYLKRGNSPGINWGSYENGEGQIVTERIGHLSKETALLSDFNMGLFRRCEKGYSSEIFKNIKIKEALIRGREGTYYIGKCILLL